MNKFERERILLDEVFGFEVLEDQIQELTFAIAESFDSTSIPKNSLLDCYAATLLLQQKKPEKKLLVEKAKTIQLVCLGLCIKEKILAPDHLEIFQADFEELPAVSFCACLHNSGIKTLSFTLCDLHVGRMDFILAVMWPELENLAIRASDITVLNHKPVKKRVFYCIGTINDKALREHTFSNFKSLDLHGNRFGNDGFNAILVSLYDRLEILELADTGITRIDIDLLHMCSSLRTLDLSFNFIGSEGFQVILLSLSDTITELSVIFCDIAEVDEEALAPCSNLRILNISCNPIGDHGYLCILHTLYGTIEKLNLYDCEITRIYGNLLENCVNLKYLWLNYDFFTKHPRQTKEFIRVLKRLWPIEIPSLSFEISNHALMMKSLYFRKRVYLAFVHRSCRYKDLTNQTNCWFAYLPHELVKLISLMIQN